MIQQRKILIQQIRILIQQRMTTKKKKKNVRMIHNGGSTAKHTNVHFLLKDLSNVKVKANGKDLIKK